MRMLVDMHRLMWADAEHIERGLHAFCTDTEHYARLAKKVGHNVHYNPSVLRAYPLDELASLTHDQLRGPVLERFQEAEAERTRSVAKLLKQTYDNVNATAITSSALRCRVCKSSDVAWQQKQTRGADESMTIFCSCGACGTRWKMS
jgi:DNA-directed RNA polymerase subunit M/transcription elongation factor TFIIS